MILECSCGKMYRVRDDATNPPTKCPVCGGVLRAAGGSSTSLPAAADARVKELEERIKDLERELRSAKSSGAAAPAAVADLAAAAERADGLEQQLLDLRSQTERELREKDRQLAQARDAAEREAAERRRVESRLNGLEETQRSALAEKQKTIEALDASLAGYREKLAALQKRADQAELQRMADQNGFESRLRDRDRQEREAVEEARRENQQALADLRAELEGQISDKDRQITEGRQLIDREAGERRRLSEVLSRLQENADRTLKEKDAAIAALEAGAASSKTKLAALQKRVDDLERLRRSEQDAAAARLRAREGLRARVDESSNLATDLDHTLESVDAMMSGLHERVRRLKQSLNSSEPEEEASAPLSLSQTSFTEPEPEPMRPALSQADAFAAPAPAEEEPAPLEEAAPAADAVLEEPAPQGRTDPPSQIDLPAVSPAEEEPPAPPTRAPEEEIREAVPLMSPPEEEAPAPTPPPAKRDEPKRGARFSWNRKK
jgi:chromosome segregation ATPase